jgi:hypothetical protein
MWVAIRDFFVNVLISGAYEFLLNNWVSIVALIVGSVGTAIVFLLKKGVAFLPATEEAAADADIDGIKTILNTAWTSAETKINTLITNARADGKISKDEVVSIIKATYTDVIEAIGSETIKALSEKFGDIAEIIKAWVIAKVKQTIVDAVKDKASDLADEAEKVLAKIGLKIDLNGDGIKGGSVSD